MILRVLQRVWALQAADEVVVATDSAEILAIVGAAGGTAVMTSTRHPSGTDRIAEVARRSEFRGYDAVVNVQGDEPFVSAAAVKGAIEQVTQRGLMLGTAAVQAKADVLASSDVVKVVTDDDGRAMYFSRAPIPYLRDEADVAERDARVLHHVGVYAYTPESLERWITLPPHPLERIERLEQLRPLAAGMRMGVAIIPGPLRPGIDTEADLERANREWQTSTVMDD